MFEYLEKLNKEQYTAATTITGPVLILAGAGTGKTHTLISRVAYMLDRGIEPENILLLTFTNKAADEMKERIISFVGEEKGKRITACTFHSFCTICLRKYPFLLDGRYDGNFTIIDEEDAKDVLKGIVHKWKKKCEDVKGRSLNFFNVSFIQKCYSTSVNEVISISSAITGWQKACGIDDYVRGCIEEYNAYKKVRNIMDYDDLLKYTYLLLHDNPEIRATLDDKYKYIMCDEYQDTNIIQDRLLDFLSQRYNNLAVVGDDNQSIYKFRGAKIENIISFPQRKPGCKTITLVENYRSTQEILNLANKAMDYADEGYKKVLHGQTIGEKPTLDVVDDQSEEAIRIADLIEQYHNLEHIPYNKMCVLSRMSNQVSFIEKELTFRNIKFAKFGGLKFFSKTTVRDILAFLRASNMYKDEIAWLKILKLYPNIGDTYGSRIAEEISFNGYEVLQDKKYQNKAYSESLSKVYQLMKALYDMNFSERMNYLVNVYYDPLITEIIENSNMEEYTKKEKLKELENTKEDRQILLEMSKDYDTITDFMDSITLAFSNPVNEKEDADLLNISTIHSAKGLEYEVVFLVGAIQGCFPKGTFVDDDYNESLRCMYVALTRAKNHLHIYVPLKYNTGRGVTDGKLSSHLAKYDILNQCVYNTDIEKVMPVA